jgi:hypothetical protein
MLISRFSLILLTFLNVDWSNGFELRKEKYYFKISIFYDNMSDNIQDETAYSVDIINRILKTTKFQFEYSIHKVEEFDSYHLTKLCQYLFFFVFIKF